MRSFMQDLTRDLINLRNARCDSPGRRKRTPHEAITLFRIWEVEEMQERRVITAEVLNIRRNLDWDVSSGRRYLLAR